MTKIQLNLMMQEALEIQHKYAKSYKDIKKKSILSGCTNDEATTIAYNDLESLNKKRQLKSYGAMQYARKCFNNKNWDALIDFLTIDAPAFRIGYQKEYFLRKMRKVELSEAHKQEIKNFILTILQLNGYRRELKDFAKLSFTWFTDAEIDNLHKLEACATNPLHKQKIVYFYSWIIDLKKDQCHLTE